LARLQRISELVDSGINLTGVARILSLEDDNTALSSANIDLRSSNHALRNAAQAARSGKANERSAGPRG
jgi:DNA-binding transcriptional MerR regulator